MWPRLALRNLTDRPWRSVFLLLGFSMGVGVMIVLLSIGEALLLQARDERLVGGGTVTVLPEGIDVEVMKTGGLGGLYFSIDNARFVQRQLLAAPRLDSLVAASAPQIAEKLVYLRTADGREWPVKASGEIPSLTAAAGGAPRVVAGAWDDDDGDRRWRAPTPAEHLHQIDHFHLPPPEVAGDESWGEWHYFNVITADRRRWAFISLIVGGAVPDGRWGGQVLVTLHEQGRPERRFVASVPGDAVRFSTERADLAIGSSSVRVTESGRYLVRASAREERGTARVDVQLEVIPAPHAYFPGASLGEGALVSGYVVPALRASAAGSVCAPGWCESFAGAQGYHDHNWGVWRGVTWEWGAGRAGDYAFLYGRVEQPDSVAATQPLFVYLVDSLGFLGLFRPRAVAYDDVPTRLPGGGAIGVPRRAVLEDARGGDTLRIELLIEDAALTDTRVALVERGETAAARALPRPWFVQMKGLARISGTVAGRRLRGEGTGFFETYR